MKLKYYISIALFSIAKLHACSGYLSENFAKSMEQNNNIIPNIPYNIKAESVELVRPYGSYTRASEEYYTLTQENKKITIQDIPSADILSVIGRCNGTTEYQKLQQAVYYIFQRKLNKNK